MSYFDSMLTSDKLSFKDRIVEYLETIQDNGTSSDDTSAWVISSRQP